MISFHDLNGTKIAEVTDNGLLISSVQDAVDLLGELSFNNCSRVILRENNIHPDFFKLSTGLAGDVLQKFSNYSFKLAIIGDFSKFKNKSLQDFIRESNRGNRVFFIENIEAGFERLAGKQQGYIS